MGSEVFSRMCIDTFAEGMVLKLCHCQLIVNILTMEIIIFYSSSARKKSGQVRTSTQSAAHIKEQDKAAQNH